MGNTLIIIPARGGSKRLPGKNIMNFFGKPLIAYSIEIALEIDADVVVSSDNEDILNISQKFGATVLKRPENISGDFATTFSAIEHAYKTMSKNKSYDTIITLQVTNPIRPKGLLEKMIETFKNSPEADSIISVTRSREKIGTIKNGSYTPVNYSFNQRSQDLDPQYFENGLAYICKPEILGLNSMFGKNVIPFICDEDFPIVDIDEKIDFEIAKIIYKKL